MLQDYTTYIKYNYNSTSIRITIQYQLEIHLSRHFHRPFHDSVAHDDLLVVVVNFHYSRRSDSTVATRSIYNEKHRIQKLLSNAHSISDMLMIDCHCVISECKEDMGAWMRTSRTFL